MLKTQPILKNLHLVANKKVHTIERICCVCRKLQPIAQMTRVVRVDGCFFVQKERRLNGRGAHICPSCLGSNNLQKCLSRSFKAAIPNDVFDELKSLKGK